jgi:hypothetical protein
MTRYAVASADPVLPFASRSGMAARRPFRFLSFPIA